MQQNEQLIKKSNGYGTASLVMGILSIVTMGILWAILGLCFAGTSNKAALAAQTEKKGTAKAGKVLSIIGLVFSILCIIAAVIIFAMATL